MLQKILKEKIDFLNLFIKPTIDNKDQFETNIRNKFMSEFLSRVLESITNHKDYIGSTVFKFKSNFSVTTKEDYLKLSNELSPRAMNPIEENGFIYTEQDYHDFCENLINSQIDNFYEEIVSKNIYSNLTNPMSRLEHQYIIESKQNLIRFLSEIDLKLIPQ